MSISYTVRAPGKLMIAGEYAILEPNQRAVVIAINRYVTVCIEEAKTNKISIPQWGIEDISWEIVNETVEFSTRDSRLIFVENSIYIVYKFLKEKGIKTKSFKLLIESELNDPLSGKKYGLGSSAAVVVTIIESILRLHSDNNNVFTLDKIFKLSAIVHLITQKNGSGADIAAAVYGGWLEYSAFSGEWVLNEFEQGGKILDILDKSWPNLYIKSLTPPPSLQLVVGWTKEPASTAAMVKTVQDFGKYNLEVYNEFLRGSSISVSRLIKSFENKDSTEAIISLSQNRKVLKKLGENTGINIETMKLRKLCSIADTFGSGKLSGAGGGDCGIAFLLGDSQKQEIFKIWKEADIMPLDLRVSKMGVSIQ